VLACALGSGVSGAVGSEGELPYGEFSTRVVISVGGQPTMIGPFTGLDEAVATAVRVQLERQEFVAATRDGAAVDSDAFVEGRIVLVPAGTEDYDVQLRDVRLKPARAVSTPKPRYPSREFQRKAAGHVELELLVDADGNVAGATTISAATPGFEKAAREAALAWTFQTTGRPVRMAVPFWFHREGARPSEPPAFACATPAGEPRLKGQGGCEERVDTILTVMKVVDGATR